jgi:hypothetical protein
VLRQYVSLHSVEMYSMGPNKVAAFDGLRHLLLFVPQRYCLLGTDSDVIAQMLLTLGYPLP